MSVWIISKTDVDAYVSVAYRWTEAGQVDQMPVEVAAVLRVTDDNAGQVGARLWAANHDAFNYGGPKRLADPELLAELEESEDIAQMPPYEFLPFAGMPSAEIALNRAGYYSYQTRGDYWESPADWEGGREPFEVMFTFAMEWWACKSLGVEPKVKLYRKPGRFLWTRDDGQVDHPSGLRTPEGRSIWLLEETDRDLFTRDLEIV